jgi:uncharacterized protein
MKTLPYKVRQVERLYASLDKQIAEAQAASGLYCLSGCGECCKKPDIEATALEFLPLALYYFDQGQAETMHAALKQSPSGICHLFRPNVTAFGGLCSQYPHRGLICRLFGYSARRNKEGKPELLTCKLLKENSSQEVASMQGRMLSAKGIPMMSDYYSRLIQIDPSLSTLYPINEAAVKALEVVMHYYAYRRRRKPNRETS